MTDPIEVRAKFLQGTDLFSKKFIAIMDDINEVAEGKSSLLTLDQEECDAMSNTIAMMVHVLQNQSLLLTGLVEDGILDLTEIEPPVAH